MVQKLQQNDIHENINEFVQISLLLNEILMLPDLVAMDLENPLLLNEGTYNGLQAYKNSKAANIMFTYELARRLEGSGVTANAVDPG